jgi:hypothetical protein
MPDHTTLANKLQDKDIDLATVDVSDIDRQLTNQGVPVAGYTNDGDRYALLYYDSDELDSALDELLATPNRKVAEVTPVVEEKPANKSTKKVDETIAA